MFSVVSFFLFELDSEKEFLDRAIDTTIGSGSSQNCWRNLIRSCCRNSLRKSQRKSCRNFVKNSQNNSGIRNLWKTHLRELQNALLEEFQKKSAGVLVGSPGEIPRGVAGGTSIILPGGILGGVPVEILERRFLDELRKYFLRNPAIIAGKNPGRFFRVNPTTILGI